MLSNNHLQLRAPEPADLDTLYAWENDPELWILSESTVPLSRVLLKEYIESAKTDIYTAGQLRLMIEEKTKPSIIIGAVDIFDFDSRNQRAGLGILIDKEHRRKGYASMGIAMVMQYCFEHLGLHQLYCNIQKSHTASLHLFQKHGFEIVGLKKDWLRVGHQFEDVYLLQHLHPKVS